MTVQRVQLWRVFVWGRTAVTAAFLIILFLINGYPWPARLDPIFAVAALQLATNFPYFFLSKLRDLNILGFVTFGLEIILITLLILNFGNDGYVFLLAYLWPLAMAGWLVGRRAILPLALLSSVAYGVLIILRSYSLIYTDHVMMADGQTSQALVLAALYLVFCSLLLWAMSVEKERGDAALARHNESLQSLVTAESMLSAAHSFEALLDAIQDRAGMLVHAERLGIYLYQDGEPVLEREQGAYENWASSVSLVDHAAIRHPGDDMSAREVRVVRVELSSNHKRKSLPAVVVYVPLFGNSGVLGMLAFFSHRMPSDEERWAYRIFGHQVGVSIENVQLIERLQRQTDTVSAVLAHMSEAVFLLDEQYRVLLANRAAGDLLGVYQWQPLPEFMRGHLQNEVHDDPSRNRVLVPTGDRIVTLSSAELPQAGDLPASTIHVAQDFTHEAEVERMKTDFVAYASHELRTPLTTIKMLTGLLKTHSLDRSKQDEYLEIIDTQIERQTRLVTNLLDLTSLETGTYELTPEKVTLPLVLQPIVEAIQPLADAKGLDLSCSVETTAPIIANSAGIEQIVTNLLSNAIKFTDAGGSVSLECWDDAEQVTIAVRDTGIGMGPDQCERIFDRLYTVRNPRKKGEGTGLGLAISSMIAKKLGGTIEVESIKGEGSLFSLKLPKQQARVAQKSIA